MNAAVLALALAVVVLSGASPPRDSGRHLRSAAAPRGVEVHLNGRKLADAIALPRSTAPVADDVLVPVASLAQAIDGSGAPTSRLRVRGTRLFAVASGACGDCLVAVARPVLISSRVRVLEDAAYVPLADLVAAFEGRLEVDRTRGIWHVYTGRCSWCILAPASPADTDRRSMTN